MVSLLNFGDSPFKLLFFIVLAILVAVIIANVTAFVLSQLVDAQARKVARRYDPKN